MDDEYDDCEYFWIHEIAMRRLLNLLRQSQAYCTDIECLSDVSSGLQPQRNSNNEVFLIVMIWFFIAAFLYYMRPNSMRSRERKNHQSGGSDSGNNPPPALN